MAEKLFDTESLCPECLKKIPAWYEKDEQGVYICKECPEHGSYRVLFWRDVEMYEAWREQSVHAETKDLARPCLKGCPYDCGLCDEHEGGTCTAILEVTYRCNMKCSVCFADTTKEQFDPDMNEIKTMFETARKNGGQCSVQLSGGEPTLRDDLPEIVAMGKSMGFGHLQVNTNGLRISEDYEYLLALKNAGADLIYLQFDGTTGKIYETIRGRDIFDVKKKVIENCRKVGIGVLLVPTIIPSVNLDNIGEIIKFAKENMPVVKGVHFQPVSYFGRFPGSIPSDEERCGLCDVVNALEKQTDGEINMSGIVPRKRYDPHCAFSSLFYLPENGKLQTITKEKQNEMLSGKTDFAAKTNAFTSKHWAMPKPGKKAEKSPHIAMEKFKARLRDYTLAVSGMGFQDVWNIDISRLRGCCVQVVASDGNAVPLCIFHLTSAGGKRVYRNE